MSFLVLFAICMLRAVIACGGQFGPDTPPVRASQPVLSSPRRKTFAALLNRRLDRTAIRWLAVSSE